MLRPFHSFPICKPEQHARITHLLGATARPAMPACIREGQLAFEGIPLVDQCSGPVGADRTAMDTGSLCWCKHCHLLGAGVMHWQGHVIPEWAALWQAHTPENLEGLHSALISSYVAQAGGCELVNLPDDGYILQTLGHHLACAKRLDELKDLLSNPDWLEAKLHGYGTINVVADFRR